MPTSASTPHRSSPPGAMARLLMQVEDALVWPLLVLHPDGTLLSANLAARGLLHTGHPLSVSNDARLTLQTESLQAAFDTALHEASCRERRGLLHWPATAGSGAYAATLSPLRAVPESGTDGGQPRPGTEPCPVLLALSSADSRQEAAWAYASLHGLSGAEARVLQHLACGESSVDIARALGVNASTVRSQFLNLRRKTGQDSVAGLLNALMRMPPLMPPGGPADPAPARPTPAP